MSRLMAFHWPGNIRELENTVRRMAVQDVKVIKEEHLPPEIEAAGRTVLPGTLREAEEQAIRRALEATKGNKAQAARVLGVDRKTLYAKLKQFSDA